MIPFNIIVAVDAQNGIGKDGELPWRLPSDLKLFKEITTANSKGRTNIVIMGRKTWESIPHNFRPLESRQNMVLTRNKDYVVPEGVLIAGSLREAMDVFKLSEWAQKMGDIFVIGGQEVFSQAIQLPNCQKLYVTHILDRFECDTVFPDISKEFEEIQRTDTKVEEGISYYFSEYIRRKCSKA